MGQAIRTRNIVFPLVALVLVPVLVYQGGLTLAAASADAFLTDRMILELTSAGGVIVMGIALRLLEIKQVRAGSLLPALALPPLLVALFAR